MKTTISILALVFVATSGINWLWGVATLFTWFFVEIVQFLFTPRNQ